MKSKTTLKPFKNFSEINHKKHILSLFAIELKKAPLNSFSTIYISVLLLLLSTSIAFSQSSLCQAKVFADHDLNVGSSSPKGTYYKMVITNTGSSTNTYILSATNINSTCSNTDGSSTAGNVNLETSFVDTNMSPINEISVSAGQSVNFYSHVIIPLGTNIKKWCCTEVFADSKDCSNYKVSTVLHTFYSGPDED
jgi:hypothetical protein